MLDSVQSKNTAPLQPESPKSHSHFRWGLVALMLVLLAVGIFLGSKVVIFAQKIFENNGQPLSFRELFLAPDRKLIGEDEKAIRLLLLGIGGEGHDGGTLTDTIILATIKPGLKPADTRVGLVSIPRDLVAFIPRYDYRKINSAYAFGELGGNNQGPILATAVVEDLLGLEIPYYGVIDFAGFKKVIDDLGGLEIEVSQGFTDARYPDGRDGYLPPLVFEEGRQKMDGERTLQYVRSRHGSNNQGSDFARSRRQLEVLKTLRDKTTSLRILTNLNLIDDLLNDLSDHVRTNLAPNELNRLYQMLRGVPDQNILTLSISHEANLVCNQIVEETGAFILVPCAGLGKYEALRHVVNNQFLLAGLQREQPRVEIQNASPISFLSQRTQSFLETPFLNVATSNFRGQTRYFESIIYDNTRGQKPETLNYLKDRLGIRVAQSPFPFPAATANPDFVIIVTADLETKLP